MSMKKKNIKESDLFTRKSPSEVMVHALQIRRKACGLKPIDYVREFTI
jgi:hypothetical protein